MSDHLLKLQTAFKPFATLSVFLSSKQGHDSALEFDAISAAVCQSTGYQLTVEDLALIRGMLGPQVLDIVSSQKPHQLQFKIHFSALASTDLPKRIKRPRTSSTELPPIQLITRLIDRFAAAASRLSSADNLEEALEALIQTHMPLSGDTKNKVQMRTVEELIEMLRSNQIGGSGQLVNSATRTKSACSAKFQEFSSIDPAIWKALASLRGITRLYTHQAQAIDSIFQSKHIVVNTATASGKSLIYQIPILQILLRNPQARFLLLFPTKALAQDQERSLKQLVAQIPQLQVFVDALDGDTPNTKGCPERQLISERSQIILTNFDTLHTSMLPNVSRWRAFWSRLHLVVIDELHIYQHTFGQHVSHILSRLQRFVHPQFVACSATTSNPGEHLAQLCSLDPKSVYMVDQNGAPQGQRTMMLWDSQPHQHSTIFSDTTLIASYILSNGLRAVVFCRTRQACELVFREIVDYIEQQHGLLADKAAQVVCYRGGYALSERRDIEQRLFNNQIQMVVATSALELGIDVGALDVALIVGAPHSQSSLWQQSGRAGRRNQPCLTLVVAENSPLDRRIVGQYCDLFEQQFAPARISTNPSISTAHLQCAAFERPLDRKYDCGFALQLHKDLLDPDNVPLPWDQATNSWCCALSFKPWPPLLVPIRSKNNDNDRLLWRVLVMPSLRVLEEMDVWRAQFTLYESAILFYQGQTFSIESIDVDNRLALSSLTNVSWFTRASCRVDIVPVLAERAIKLAESRWICRGSVNISSTVVGYTRVDARTKRTIEYVSLPQTSSHKTSADGVWIDLSLADLHMLSSNKYSVSDSIHAAQHALCSAISTAAGCDIAEICTACTNPSDKRLRRQRLLALHTDAQLLSTQQ
ncbi:ATP-dependent 3'-5' DNA helicase [Coemansia brasiliensis]|uniref:ATP-dependent 3'-5' DNA helicase n=1 Tax=Coemansia brasiliensis TaxID=2650707 RepID=A0A9W8I8Q9_9FUNG|nr:ATP-dependent 3'-5' DNA helicase [Coemansia brasiliensis]